MPELIHKGNSHLLAGLITKWSMLPVLLLALTACSGASIPVTLSTATPTPPGTSTEAASTPSPTPIPKGSDANPITMGIVWSDEGKQSPAAAQFIQYLADTTGYVFALQPYDSMIDLIGAMDRNEASFAWLQPEDYLYAYENNIANAAFLTSHYGLYAYGSSVYVKFDSGFEMDFDEATASSNTDASSALQQFSDKVPCLVNTHSISGFAYPLGILAQNNIQTQEPLLLQTHEAVIRAIYSGGICDFGFTYGISGDPRTSSSIQKDLPDVMDKVRIAWQSPAEIPSLNFSYSTLLAGDIRFAISTALENYAKTPEGLQTLSDMNNYSIDGIRAASDDDYQALRDLLLAASINSESLISR